MISFLKGKYCEKSGRGFVIVNDVGYRIKTSQKYSNDTSVELLVTCITMSTGETILYGFSEEKEQIIFEELIKVQGVGGNVALNILSNLGVEALAKSVNSKDRTALSTIKGVGPKVVDRILSSLTIPNTVHLNESNDLIDEALEALLALGFKNKEARDLLDSLSSSNFTTAAEYVAKALQNKGKG